MDEEKFGTIDLIGQLDVKISTVKIKEQLKEIEKKLPKIPITITVNEEVLEVIKKFNKEMEKFKQVKEEMNRVVFQETEVLEDNEQITRKLVRAKLESGEVIQKEIVVHKKKTEALEEEASGLKKVAKGYGELEKQVTKFNAQNKPSGFIETYRTGLGKTHTFHLDEEEYIRYSVLTENLAQASKATDALIASQKRLVGKVNEVSETFKSAGVEVSKYKNDLDSLVGEIMSLKPDDKNIKAHKQDIQARIDALKKQASEEARLAKERAKAEAKAQAEMEDAFRKTEENRRKEIKKSEEAQTRAINKGIELREKEKQAEINRIKSLGQLIKNDDLKGISFTEQDFDYTDPEKVKQIDQWAKAIAGADATVRSFTFSGAKAKEGIAQLTIAIPTGADTFRELKVNVDLATQSFYQHGVGVEKTLSRNLTFFKQFQIALTRIPIWMAGMTGFYGTLRAFQSGVARMGEIDKAMTDLRKVTDETTQTYRDFAIEAGNTATALAKTTKEIISSTASFARLGYNLQQAKILAQEAMLYSNVGDIDVETASQDIISAVKGFGIAVDQEGRNVRRIVDIYNEVGKLLPLISVMV